MDNLNPNIWGPPGWRFMHYITFSYPNNPTEEHKEKIKNFFNSVKHVLPCEKCRVNFIKHLEIYPLNDEVLKNKKSLVVWLMNIHNEVNKINNKKIYTFEDTYNEYILLKNNNTKKNINKNESNILNIIFILIIIIILLKFIKK